MMEETSSVQSDASDDLSSDWIPGPVRIPVIPDIVDLGQVATVSSGIKQFSTKLKNYLDIRDRKITVDTDSPAHRDWQEIRSILYRNQEETLGRSFNAVKDDIDADRRIIAMLADVSDEGVSARELSKFLIPHRTEQEILDAMSWVDENTGDEFGLVRIDGGPWKRSRILNVKTLLTPEVRTFLTALTKFSYESGEEDAKLIDQEPLTISPMVGLVKKKFSASIRPRKSDIDVRQSIETVSKRLGMFLIDVIRGYTGEELIAVQNLDDEVVMVMGWRWLMRIAVPEFDESPPRIDSESMSASELRQRLTSAIIGTGVDYIQVDVDEAAENAAEYIEDMYPERFSGIDEDTDDWDGETGMPVALGQE